MCKYVDSQYIAPGWGCCHCEKTRGVGQYNGMQRGICRACGIPSCTILAPDNDTGKVFENRDNHKDLYNDLGLNPAVKETPNVK